MSSGRRSPPQDPGNSSAGRVEPFYTNEDVAVLHDIVVLAQELLPGLPERERLPTNALFSAYYDILPRLGINADHDSRYARILFKIGGLREEGTLYEKFEEILSRMGIEIEFDERDHDSDSQHENRQTDLEITGAIPQDENIPPRGRPRRNSDSAWDIEIDLSNPRQRRNSHSALNKATPIPDRQGLRDALLQQHISNQTTELPEEAEIEPGSNVGAWLNAKPVPPRKERGRSISTHASFRIRRRSPSLATRRPAPTTNTSDPTSDDYHAESEITAVTSAHEPEDTTDSIDISQVPPPFKPSSSLLQIKAEEILQDHLHFLAKRQLRTWRDKALQLRENNANHELLALHHDKNALLNQALQSWHGRYLEKRSIAETERFFAHLERRSVKIRDLYVLQRAFTHWHKHASDEAERTRAARRHILRTRIFNAWRDITVVNELKARRQVLKKFLGVWRRQTSIISGNGASALQKYEGNMVEKIFNQWVHNVWDIKATTWWVEGVKQRTFPLWIAAARKILENRRTAEEERRLQLAWNAWRVWRDNTQEHIRQKGQANTFRYACLAVGAIRKWRRETQVIPAKKTLQTDVDTRLLRHAFAIWLCRARQEKQATAVDRMRILREAWISWRLKQRLQVARTQVNGRIVFENLFKWILTARAAENGRLLTEKRLRNTLQHWARRAWKTKYQRWDQEGLAEQFSIQKTQRLVVSRWSARSRSQQQLDADAMDFYASRKLQGVVSQWTEKAQHVQQLQRWSRDAEFYFLTSKTLKRWQTSTEDAKREKRKAAYAEVRRTTKMNLARGILLGWRSKARQILEMKAQARDIHQNKNVIVGMEIFDLWRARTEELGELEALWRERVLRKHFVTWQSRSVAFQDLTVEAIINFQERRQSRAIKKWNLGMLQLRAQYIYATKIQEKNAKRTFRKMFNYWHQKAAEKRPVKRIEEPGLSQLGATIRAEAWSDFGDEAEGDEWAKGLDAITSTPAPGYLSTPSRRTERVAAAAARFSSTTPRAPLSTPFERQLRAQYSGGGLQSLRKGPGRSALGLGGGFPDIADRGTNDDQGRT